MAKKTSLVKKIEKIYDDAGAKLKELSALQDKIIKKHMKQLEKAKIKRLQEELQK